MAARRERLIDAAFELLGTEGWTATTVRGVCRAARLNPRYFYESFADLDALVVAVFDRLVHEGAHRLVTALAATDEDPPAAQARVGVETVARFLTEDPRRARVLFVEARGNEALAQRRLDTMFALAELAERYGRKRYGQPEGGDQIAAVTANLLVGGGTELVVAWLDGRLDVTMEQLVEDFTALALVTGEGAVGIARQRARATRPASADL